MTHRAAAVPTRRALANVQVPELFRTPPTPPALWAQFCGDLATDAAGRCRVLDTQVAPVHPAPRPAPPQAPTGAPPSTVSRAVSQAPTAASSARTAATTANVTLSPFLALGTRVDGTGYRVIIVGGSVRYDDIDPMPLAIGNDGVLSFWSEDDLSRGRFVKKNRIACWISLLAARPSMARPPDCHWKLAKLAIGEPTPEHAGGRCGSANLRGMEQTMFASPRPESW
eukprot:TRINITY_DN67233_c0_g1_i1.p1 TRINITY_DN67233_c0_g1~~TRINITY_DN67233_c0_g1_i1.p1  ORF type:complete len:226 (-),score=29.34 TRINITY_DN67233_c0_g1_i1:187-864(-)